MSISLIAGALLLGLAAGALLAAIASNRRLTPLRERLETAREEAAAAKASLESERRLHSSEVAGLRALGEEVETKFAALSSEALRQSGEDFLKLVSERFQRHQTAASEEMKARHRKLEAVVDPLGKALGKFEKSVQELESKREGAYGTVSEQVKNLAASQRRLENETGRLVKALRRPQTRGRWGEVQLRRVLEMAGMLENVDFEEQPGLRNPDGALRPDAVVRLPGERSVVVDAKTPLEAYLAGAEAESEAARRAALTRHARQLRTHVEALSSKEYWNALSTSPDFVVMFLPGEALFAGALEVDAELFEYAAERQVLIATPMTFIALAKAVAWGWRQQSLADDMKELATLGRELVERVRKFTGHLRDLGSSLHTAVKRYNASVGSFEHRLLPTARRLEEMQKAGSDLPQLEPVPTAVRQLAADVGDPDESPDPDSVRSLAVYRASDASAA